MRKTGAFQMPRETTYLPTNEKMASLAVMALYAIIAYPDDRNKRDRFVNALRALFSKEYIRRGGLRSKIEDKYRQLPNQQINGQLNRAFNQIYKRFQANMIFQQRVMREFGLDGPALGRAKFILKRNKHTGAVKLFSQKNKNNRPTITSVIKDFNPVDMEDLDAGDHAWSNTFSRTWAPSKPVLHLVGELELALFDKFTKATTFEWVLLNAISDPSWLQKCLDGAEKRRRLWLLVNESPCPDEDTIQVLPDSKAQEGLSWSKLDH